MANIFSSLFGNLFSSPRMKQKQYSTLNPEQRNLLSPLYSGLQGNNQQFSDILSQLLNYEPEGLEDMQAPALRQFEEEVVPSILERFAGSNSRASSGLNQALSGAGKNLTTDLASMRAQLLQQKPQIRSNALQTLLGYNQYLTNPNMTYNTLQPQSGGLSNLLGMLGGFAGNRLFGGY